MLMLTAKDGEYEEEMSLRPTMGRSGPPDPGASGQSAAAIRSKLLGGAMFAKSSKTSCRTRPHGGLPRAGSCMMTL